MKYLLLDKEFNIVERIDSEELKKRMNKKKTIADFLLYEGIINGLTVIEDDAVYEDKKKFVCETKRAKYYATPNGDFYSVSKKTHKRNLLKIHKVKGEARVNLGRKHCSVSRTLAKLFLPEFDESKIVRIKNPDKKITVENIYIVDKEFHYKNINNRPVGIYDNNNKLLQKFNSEKEAAEKLNCSISSISLMINRENNKGWCRYL